MRFRLYASLLWAQYRETIPTTAEHYGKRSMDQGSTFYAVSA